MGEKKSTTRSKKKPTGKPDRQFQKRQEEATAGSTPGQSTVPTLETTAISKVEELQKAVFSDDAVQSWSDIAEGLSSLPLPIAQQFLREILERKGERALLILEPLALGEKMGPALASVEALADHPSETAAALLARCAAEAPSREVKKAARRGLFRLRSRGYAVPEIPATRESEPVVAAHATIFAARASQIDPVGDRLVEIGVEMPNGDIVDITAILNEMDGIKDCDAIISNRRRYEARRAERNARDFPLWVDIPIDYAKQLMVEAKKKSVQQHHGFSLDFLTWEHLIAETETEVAPPIYGLISSLEIRWNPTLLEKSAGLLAELEVALWLVGSSKMETYEARLREAAKPPLILMPWGEEERTAQVESEIVEEIFGGERRHAWKRRLEETAFIFQQTNRPMQAKMALAAAIALADQNRPLVKQPLLMAIWHESLDLFRASHARHQEGWHQHGGLILPSD